AWQPPRCGGASENRLLGPSACISCPGTAYRGGYQLAFTTPGISPFSAIPRKQIRHIWNLRIYPRARPQQRQRLRMRTLNFGFFSDLAIFAVRAFIAPLLFRETATRAPSAARALAHHS